MRRQAGRRMLAVQARQAPEREGRAMNLQATLIAAVVAATAIGGPSAEARQASTRQLAHRAGPATTATLETGYPRTGSSACPCNAGLPGGPAGAAIAGPVVRAEVRRAATNERAHAPATTATPRTGH